MHVQAKMPPLKVLSASRDVIFSGQICGSRLQRVFTLGDACWLPKQGGFGLLRMEEMLGGGLFRGGGGLGCIRVWRALATEGVLNTLFVGQSCHPVFVLML